MLELISMHIPKTGGISIKQLLEFKYKDRLRYDYPPQGFEKNKNILTYVGNNIVNRFKKMDYACAHGHFPALKYSGTNARMITFIRNPIELRASSWYYIRRETEHQGLRNPDWIAANKLDVEEYIVSRYPLFERYFKLVSMKRFSFIGMTEELDDDFARLANLLRVEYAPTRDNANPSGSYYSLGRDIFSAWKKNNPKEARIYESALKRREELIKFPTPW